MKVLEYKDANEMIKNLAIKEKSSYFICECPECGGKEAYVYKANLNKLKCSRENVCGEEFNIKYSSNEKNILFKEDKTILEKEIKLSSTLTNFYENNVNKEYFPGFNYRGLENEILKKADVYISKPDSKFEINFKNPEVNIFQTKVNDLSIGTARYDMIFPIKNDEGKITRLVYRSEKDEQYVKEFPKTIVQKSSDVLKLDINDDIIIVSESILDGLSLKQSYDAGLYACRGITKARGLCYELVNNKTFWKDKTLLIGFDDDEAGYKYTTEITNACKEVGIECIPLEVPGNYKDWNDVLQANGKEYVSSNIDNQIRDRISKYLSEEDIKKLTSLSEKHLNKCLKNEFLQTHYLNVFSKQINVGPVNALILDLQYENSFYANEDVIRSISQNKKINFKDFDCKLLLKKDQETFTDENGEERRLSTATPSEQRMLASNELDIKRISDYDLISSRIALSKEMVNKNIDLGKSNAFISALLDKYNYNISHDNDIIYDYTKKDCDIEFGNSISTEKKFEVLSQELVSQNKDLPDTLRDCATKFFISNFNDIIIKYDKNVVSLEDARLLMKTNHALISVFEKHNLFTYELSEIATTPRAGLEEGMKGSEFNNIKLSTDMNL